MWKSLVVSTMHMISYLTSKKKWRNALTVWITVFVWLLFLLEVITMFVWHSIVKCLHVGRVQTWVSLLSTFGPWVRPCSEIQLASLNWRSAYLRDWYIVCMLPVVCCSRPWTPTFKPLYIISRVRWKTSRWLLARIPTSRKLIGIYKNKQHHFRLRFPP